MRRAGGRKKALKTNRCKKLIGEFDVTLTDATLRAYRTGDPKRVLLWVLDPYSRKGVIKFSKSRREFTGLQRLGILVPFLPQRAARS